MLGNNNILSSTFNLIDITTFDFKAGEVHCRFDQDLKPFQNLVYLKESNPNDLIMRILMVDDVLKYHNHEAELFLPYLPYSRQDRRTSENEPFSLKVLGNVLNQTAFKKIYTLDVHSDVAGACVDKLVNIKIDEIFGIFLKKYPKLIDKTLVVPDQGAYKRLSKLSSKFSNTVFALKDRDVSNGFLTIKEVIGDVNGKQCLIIDDVIDGGGTFILLADELYKKGASSVELMATHGIFSKGLDPLKAAGIRCVYTTDSFDQESDNYLAVVDVLDIISNCKR